MPVKSWFWVVLAAAALFACGKPAPIRDKISVVSAWTMPGSKVEIYSDGMLVDFTVNTDLSRTPTLDFVVTSQLRGKSHRVPDLKIRILDACGWLESPLKLDQTPNMDSIRLAAESRQPLYYTAEMPRRPYPSGTLWLDNRGGSAGILTIGTVETRVEDGKLERVEVTGCPEPVSISFAGTALGELPATPEENAKSASLWAIADPSGRRCYEEFSVYYQRTEDGGGGRSKSTILSGAKLYPRPQFITYVLKEPPGQRIIQPGEDTTTWVLKETQCPK